MPIWLITLRNLIINQLKGEAFKRASLLVFKSQALGGFRGWLIKVIVKHFFEEIGEPIIKASFIQLNYTYDRIEGKILIKKLKDAKNENNQTAYDNTTDIIFDN